MNRLRKLFHIHRDPNYQVEGVNVYYQCKCGARRTRLAYSNLMGPVKSGWPGLIDSHGYGVSDSGWKKAA